jgi:hypothetical protein
VLNVAAIEDGVERHARGFKVVPYDMPRGCCAAYYPETNNVLTLSHRDERSNTPAAKSVPVKIKLMHPLKGTQIASEKAAFSPEEPVLMPIA